MDHSIIDRLIALFVSREANDQALFEENYRSAWPQLSESGRDELLHRLAVEIGKMRELQVEKRAAVA